MGFQLQKNMKPVYDLDRLRTQPSAKNPANDFSAVPGPEIARI